MTTGEHDLHDTIAALWARQRDEMFRRVDVVERALASLGAGALAEDERAEAERAAHKIAGAAGSFGFADASVHAREIELTLRRAPSAADASRLTDLAAAMRDDLGRSNASATGDATTNGAAEPAATDVLILCGEQLLETQLEAELAGRGLGSLIARPDDELARRARATVVVLDLAEDAAARYLAEFDPSTGVAVIGLASDTGLNARVDFVRRGGRVLLPAGVAPREIADAVESLRERLDAEGTRILVVDDDPALLELTSTILRGRGLDVIALEATNRFWQTLEARNPDVVLLDLEMPGFNGLELCRAIRADPRWAQLPVMFLTARTEPEFVAAVFAAGADDYMSKPVVEEELVQRIQNRLERIRLLSDLADRDALTGVANRRKASEQLARLARLAVRYGQPMTLAILDLDHFKQVNDDFGHEIGDEVLRRLGRRLAAEFRGEDVVGRWGGEEFVIGMYGMPGTLGVDRLRELLESWKCERFRNPRGGEFATSFTVGLAELPATAGSLDDLLHAADDALYRGKAAGRGRVQPAGARAEPGAEAVDIVVVEDDSALSELLVTALADQGWTVRVVDDGRTAVGALASAPPLLEARLILLDWDLPGVDGLAVLRRLRERGVLARTRVVMLTARDDERAIVEALELGASDHIAKPFSVPVLLQKARQIVGEGSA